MERQFWRVAHQAREPLLAKARAPRLQQRHKSRRQLGRALRREDRAGRADVRCSAIKRVAAVIGFPLLTTEKGAREVPQGNVVEPANRLGRGGKT